MKITAENTEIAKIKCNILLTGIFEDDKTLNAGQALLDKELKGIISNYLIKKEEFSAKFMETYMLPTYKKMEIDKVLVVGLGKKSEFNLNKVRELFSKIYSTIDKLSKNKVVACELLGVETKKFTPFECAKAATEGFLLGEYSFNKYKSNKSESKIANLEIITSDENEKKEVERAIAIAKILSGAQNFTRNLVNEPAAVTTPSKLAKIAKEIASKYDKVQCKIYNKAEIESLNFGAFLAVARGSAEEPKFIHLKYSSPEPRKKIVLIGKGITFDSGGLDIKPANSMMTMKCDMSGCATVLGVMNAIAQIEPEIELHVLSAVCENMPSGKAYKQGDILTSRNGKTIEVDNTDAEGRLTLADVLSYADDLSPDEIIDIATLTGACVVALGSNISGIMGRNTAMINKIIKTGEYCGESLWQLPIQECMQEALKSDVADMRNTGSRNAGASVAGQFLSNFVKNQNWVHIDIAGTAFIEKPFKELSKGGTGALVRTLTNYIVAP